MRKSSRLDQELKRIEVLQQEAKKLRVVCTLDHRFMDKIIMGKSAAAAAPPCINKKFQTPQLSSMMPVLLKHEHRNRPI